MLADFKQSSKKLRCKICGKYIVIKVICKLRIRAEMHIEMLLSSMSALKVLVSNFYIIFVYVVINLSVLLCKCVYTQLWMQN